MFGKIVIVLKNNLSPDYLSNLVGKNREVHQYETRQADKFHFKKMKQSQNVGQFKHKAGAGV